MPPNRGGGRPGLRASSATASASFSSTDALRTPARRSGSLEPIPSHEKNWRISDLSWLVLNFCAQPTVYMLGPLGLFFGLSWLYVLLAVFASSIFITFFVTLSTQPSAKYGIPSCVTARSSFGYYGSKFYSLLVLPLLLIWTAYTTNLAAMALSAGMKEDMPNLDFFSFGKVWKGDTSRLCVLLGLYLLHMVISLINPVRIMERMQGLVTALVLSFYVSLLVWVFQTVGADLALKVTEQIEPTETFPPYIGFLVVMTAGISTWSGLFTALPDVARYVEHQDEMRRASFMFIPPFFTLMSFVGIIALGGLRSVYKVTVIEPSGILQFLPRYVALISGIIIALSILQANILGYSLAGTNAITNIIPRFLNARSSAFIYVVLALGVNFAFGHVGEFTFDNLIFTTSILAAPPAAILACDYFSIHRSTLDIQGLFDSRLKCCGWSAVALLSLLLAYALPVAANALEMRGYPISYRLTWFLGWFGCYVLSFVSYLLFTKPCATLPCSKRNTRLRQEPIQPQPEPQEQRTHSHVDFERIDYERIDYYLEPTSPNPSAPEALVEHYMPVASSTSQETKAEYTAHAHVLDNSVKPISLGKIVVNNREQRPSPYGIWKS